MTRIRRDTDLIQATLDLRRAGELLAHPCVHGDKPHTLGTHLFHATRDMRPGIKAAGPGANTNSGTGEPSLEQTQRDAHDDYLALVERAQTVALDLVGFIERNRPDREFAVVEAPTSDDDWCRACLAAGYCEPRFRNESLCRWCTEYRLAWRIEPPIDIIKLRKDGKRISVGQITASNKTERKRLNIEKRKQQREQRTA